MIRKAKIKEIDEIVDLIDLFEREIEEIYEGDFGEININKDIIKKFLIEGFEDKYHTILVMEENEHLIGFGDMWMYPEFGHAGYSANLQNLYIKKQFQNQGHGKKLLNEFIEIAKNKKASAFHITTGFKNNKAITFYKKMGITDEGLLLDKVFSYY